ncbi:hypothetical protein [Terrisporobacter petrolearius]
MLIIALVMFSKNIYYDKIIQSTIGLTCVLVFIGLIGMIINNVELYWIIYYLIYWIVPFIVIIISKQVKLDIYKFNKVLLVIVALHCLVIYIQRFTNSIWWPFVNDEYGNKIFYISEGYYNTIDRMVRCPGICISGLDAGILLLFGCVLIYFMKFKKKVIKYIWYVFFLLGVWFTGTRNIYFVMLYMIIYVYIMKITPKKLRPLFGNIYMIICTVIYTLTFFILGKHYTSATRNILTDTLSTKMRIDNWSKVFDMIKEGSILQKFFGQFKWQNNIGNIVIDNIYLELILFCGILGLIAFCTYIIFIHTQLIKVCDEKCNLLIAFISSLMIYGVGNALGNIYISLIAVCILIFYNSMNFEVRSNK